VFGIHSNNPFNKMNVAQSAPMRLRVHQIRGTDQSKPRSLRSRLKALFGDPLTIMLAMFRVEPASAITALCDALVRGQDISPFAETT
jgi:hypothetical protein